MIGLVVVDAGLDDQLDRHLGSHLDRERKRVHLGFVPLRHELLHDFSELCCVFVQALRARGRSSLRRRYLGLPLRPFLLWDDV